jgi:hypothetical protein
MSNPRNNPNPDVNSSGFGDSMGAREAIRSERRGNDIERDTSFERPIPKPADRLSRAYNNRKSGDVDSLPSRRRGN